MRSAGGPRQLRSPKRPASRGARPARNAGPVAPAAARSGRCGAAAQTQPLCATCTRPGPSFWKALPGLRRELTKLTDGPCRSLRSCRATAPACSAAPAATVRPELRPFTTAWWPPSVPAPCSQLAQAERRRGRAGRPRRRDVGAHPRRPRPAPCRQARRAPSRRARGHRGVAGPRRAHGPARAWVAATIAARPDPDERHLLQRYAVWNLLRRLRRRNKGAETTYGQADHRQAPRSAPRSACSAG